MKKSEVYNKFVLASKLQIVHVNGLTYDFLFAMAKDLEEKQSLMLVGAGPKSALPLVFHRGGVPYRGFLEGRTQGEKYCLVLHLSNMELKAPPQVTVPTTPATEAKAPEAVPLESAKPAEETPKAEKKKEPTAEKAGEPESSPKKKPGKSKK